MDHASELWKEIMTLREEIEAVRKAQMVTNLAVASFLIDAKLCDPNGFAKRLDDTQAAMPEGYQEAAVSQRLGAIAIKIQDYGRKR